MSKVAQVSVIAVLAFVVLGVPNAKGQTTLTVNNAAGTGDITDFVTGGSTPTTKAYVDSSGDIVSSTGFFQLSTDTTIQRSAAQVFNFGSSSASTSGTINASKFQVFSGTSAVTLQPPSSFTSYNFNLPTGPGSTGQPLLSAGGGTAAMTFGTLGAPYGGTGSANGAVATLCSGATTSIASGGTVYFGFGTYSTTESNQYLPVPVAGTVVAMHVQMSALPFYTVTFHARYNAGNFSPTDLTCSISTTGNPYCDVTAGSQSITEGEGSGSWDIQAIAGTGTPASRNYAICLKVTGAS